MSGSTFISSAQNDRVKALVRLRKARERHRRDLMIVEEPLVIRRALAAGQTFSEVWHCLEREAPATAELRQALVAAGAEDITVTAPVMDKVAYRERSEGLLAVAPRRHTTLKALALPVDRPALLVILAAVEKPGNLGAVLRIADGAGCDAVIVCGGTDLDNPNCLRASRGAYFTVPTVTAGPEEVESWLRERAITAVATSPDGGETWDACKLTAPTAIILGTEHDGLSDAWLAAADRTVAIPMAGTGDSLNVAASAAVLLYEAVRQRRATTGKTE